MLACESVKEKIINGKKFFEIIGLKIIHTPIFEK